MSDNSKKWDLIKIRDNTFMCLYVEDDVQSLIDFIDIHGDNWTCRTSTNNFVEYLSDVASYNNIVVIYDKNNGRFLSISSEKYISVEISF